MFDSVLGRGNVAKTRFGVGAVVSVVLHIGIIAMVVYLSTRPPPDTTEEAVVTFFASAPPPPPPPPPPKRTKRTKRVKKEILVQPKEIPTERPAEAEPEEEPEDDGSEDEGEEGGIEGGVVGGVVGGVLGGVLGGQLGSEALPFGEGMTRPVQLEGRDPQYTREALEARIQGLMIVKCIITVQGRLDNCRIIKPLPHMEKAVLDSLASKRYSPVTYQGRAVAVDYVFNIRLVLPR